MEPATSLYRTKCLEVHVDADFPMAILKLDLSDLYMELWDVRLFNGNTKLTRVYPVTLDMSATQASYSTSNLGSADVLEIRVLGDTYTIYSSIDKISDLSV